MAVGSCSHGTVHRDPSLRQGDPRQADQGLADANDYIIANSNEAMEKLQKGHYSQTPLADINESFKAQKMFTSNDLEATLFRRHGHQLVAADH